MESKIRKMKSRIDKNESWVREERNLESSGYKCRSNLESGRMKFRSNLEIR